MVNKERERETVSKLWTVNYFFLFVVLGSWFLLPPFVPLSLFFLVLFIFNIIILFMSKISYIQCRLSYRRRQKRELFPPIPCVHTYTYVRSYFHENYIWSSWGAWSKWRIGEWTTPLIIHTHVKIYFSLSFISYKDEEYSILYYMR